MSGEADEGRSRRQIKAARSVPENRSDIGMNRSGEEFDRKYEAQSGFANPTSNGNAAA